MGARTAAVGEIDPGGFGAVTIATSTQSSIDPPPHKSDGDLQLDFVDLISRAPREKLSASAAERPWNDMVDLDGLEMSQSVAC